MPSERIQRQIERTLDEAEAAAAAGDRALVIERAQVALAADSEIEDACAFVRLAEAALTSRAPATATSAEERIQILKELVSIAASSLDISEVFDGVERQVRKLIRFDHMSVSLHVPGDEFLTIRGIVGNLPGEPRSPLEGSGSGAVPRSGKPMFNSDTLLTRARASRLVCAGARRRRAATRHGRGAKRERPGSRTPGRAHRARAG